MGLYDNKETYLRLLSLLQEEYIEGEISKEEYESGILELDSTANEELIEAGKEQCINQFMETLEEMSRERGE